jgi:hypothetical protein
MNTAFRRQKSRNTEAAPTWVGAALVQEGWLSVVLPTVTGNSAKNLRQFCEDPAVELAGIEPASFGADPGLLRVQSVTAFSQSRHSHEHVADRLSH